jgi:IclR family pca regulon transcriptional regulator
LSISADIDDLAGPDFMTSLARGLAVLRAFSDQRRSLTIAKISHRTGISRAAVRRCLHTLCALGYAEADGALFSLQSKVLTLGSRLPAYCTAMGRVLLAQLSPAELDAYLGLPVLREEADELSVLLP